jgi:hypothetical protein
MAQAGATPLSLPVKSAWFKPLRHFKPKRRRASLAAAIQTWGARYPGDFITGRVAVGKRSAIATAKAPRAGLAGLAGGDAYGADQGAPRGRADTRQRGGTADGLCMPLVSCDLTANCNLQHSRVIA